MGREYEAEVAEAAGEVAEAVADRARTAARDYVRGHRDTFGGAWFEGDGVARRYVVTFVGDLAPHQAALADHAAGLQLRAARYAEAELQALVRPAIEVVDVFDPECFSEGGFDPRRGAVLLEVITADASRLRAELAERSRAHRDVAGWCRGTRRGARRRRGAGRRPSARPPRAVQRRRRGRRDSVGGDRHAQ